MISLENKSDMLPSELIQSRFRQCREFYAGYVNLSTVISKQPSNKMKQCCLATARLTEKQKVLALPDGEVSERNRSSRRISESELRYRNHNKGTRLSII